MQQRYIRHKLADNRMLDLVHTFLGISLSPQERLCNCSLAEQIRAMSIKAAADLGVEASGPKIASVAQVVLQFSAKPLLPLLTLSLPVVVLLEVLLKLAAPEAGAPGVFALVIVGSIAHLKASRATIARIFRDAGGVEEDIVAALRATMVHLMLGLQMSAASCIHMASTVILHQIMVVPGLQTPSSRHPII